MDVVNWRGWRRFDGGEGFSCDLSWRIARRADSRRAGGHFAWRRRPKPLAALRPDLPVWLDNVLGAAFALDRADRYADVLEFALAIENGAHAAPPARPKKAPYDRNPVLFRKAICGVLFAVVIMMMMRR